MSNYYSPRNVVIGRHWKRPKPKIYDCNVRDAERFYQESYKDYLQNKEFAARRGAEDRESRYDNRSSSLLHSRAESATRDGLESYSRYGDDSHRASNSYRSSSVTNQNNRDSPEGELASIEQRLTRLRKLREELGLPTESNNDTTYKSSSSTSRISARQISPVESRTSETSYSSTRTSGRSRGGESDGYREKYSNRDNDSFRGSGTDRAKNYSSHYSTTEESSRPTSKSVSFSNKEDLGSSRRYKKYDDEATSLGPSETSSYRSKSTKSKSSFGTSGDRQASASAAFDSTDNYDDDEFISNLKKKFVSSNDILERIKKMDDDI